MPLGGNRNGKQEVPQQTHPLVEAIWLFWAAITSNLMLKAPQCVKRIGEINQRIAYLCLHIKKGTKKVI